MQERIKVRIVLTAEFWDSFPMVDLIMDGVTISQHVINQKTYTIEDTVDLAMDHPHLLQIRRKNKSDDQCIIVDGKQKDQYIIIDEVIIDGVNVQNLIWDRCWYEPEYPETWATQQKNAGVDLESKIIGETWLSHNGNWYFEFSSPFYKFVIGQFR